MNRWESFIAAVVGEIKTYIGQRVTPLEQRLAAVEQRSAATLADAHKTAEIEARLAFLEMREVNAATLADAYYGPWKGDKHERGSVVTHDGSLWLAMDQTVERPGADGTPWRLIVKRGRDGRDAR